MALWTGGGTVLHYRIPLARVVLMTFLTYGLYLLYWTYITWKQYRDHKWKHYPNHAEDCYPVWHALTLLVPIYQYFRFHYHMNSFKGMMQYAGLSTNISPMGTIILLLISTILSSVSFQIYWNADQLTSREVIGITTIDVVSITIITALLAHAQGNLNRYWSSVRNNTLEDASLGIVEIVFVIIGVLLWVLTLISLINPSTVSTTTTTGSTTWGRYDNTEFSYSINLAPGWSVVDETDDGPVIRPREEAGILEIYSDDLPSGISFREFAEFMQDSMVEIAEDFDWELFEMLSFDRVREDGRDFYRFEYRVQESSEYCVSHGVAVITLSEYYPSKPYAYVVDIAICEHSLDVYDEDREAMLDSFREWDLDRNQ